MDRSLAALERLVKSTYDDPISAYGLIAESIEISQDY